jgi:hypothetical protein
VYHQGRAYPRDVFVFDLRAFIADLALLNNNNNYHNNNNNSPTDDASSESGVIMSDVCARYYTSEQLTFFQEGLLNLLVCVCVV